LKATTWFSLLQELRPGSELSGRILAYLYGYIGSRSRFATRADESSDVRMAAISLASYVGEWSHLGQATPLSLARRTPAFIISTTVAMPVILRGDGGSVASYVQELQDAYTVCMGHGSTVNNVFARRIYERLDDFAALHLLSSFFTSWAQMTTTLETLAAKYLGARRMSFYALTSELDSALELRLPLLRQLTGEQDASLEVGGIMVGVGAPKTMEQENRQQILDPRSTSRLCCYL